MDPNQRLVGQAADRPVAWEAQWKAVALAAAQSAKLCAGLR